MPDMHCFSFFLSPYLRVSLFGHKCCLFGQKRLATANLIYGRSCIPHKLSGMWRWCTQFWQMQWGHNTIIGDASHILQLVIGRSRPPIAWEADGACWEGLAVA